MSTSIQNRVPEDWITMQELCAESGFSRATIYKYLQMGLLEPAHRSGFRASYYDKTHLRTLAQIRYLREKEHLSVLQIKDILQGREPSESRASQQTEKKRDQIIEKAIEFFSENGYDETRIEDITESLGIGKGTFYSYFKNKKELLLECIGRLTLAIIPKERWQEIRDEHDPIKRTRKRLEAGLEASRFFIGVTNIVKFAVRSKDDELVDKGREAWSLITGPVVKDFKWGTQNGVFRPFDEEFYGYFYGALIEALCYMLELEPTLTVEKAINTFVDFLSYGIMNTTNEETSRAPAYDESEVIDRDGGTNTVKNIRFDGEPYLVGRVGAAEIRTGMDSVSSLVMGGKGSELESSLTMLDGTQAEMAVPGDVSVTGDCAFGRFCIPLSKVSTIKRL